MEQVKERNQYLVDGAIRAADFTFLYSILCAMGMIAAAFVFGFNLFVLTAIYLLLIGKLVAHLSGKRIDDKVASEIARTPPSEWPQMPLWLLEMVNERCPGKIYREDVQRLVDMEGSLTEALSAFRFMNTLPLRTPEPPEPEPDLPEFTPDAAWLCSL